MSDFHRVSPEMAWLRICRITNESTETENCYESLNRELRWLWNSVYDDEIKKHRLILILTGSYAQHWQFRMRLCKCLKMTLGCAH